MKGLRLALLLYGVLDDNLRIEDVRRAVERWPKTRSDEAIAWARGWEAWHAGDDTPPPRERLKFFPRGWRAR